jgi:hypothetical protein
MERLGNLFYVHVGTLGRKRRQTVRSVELRGCHWSAEEIVFWLRVSSCRHPQSRFPCFTKSPTNECSKRFGVSVTSGLVGISAMTVILGCLVIFLSPPNKGPEQYPPLGYYDFLTEPLLFICYPSIRRHMIYLLTASVV